jgi:hypothetical protein
MSSKDKNLVVKEKADAKSGKKGWTKNKIIAASIIGAAVLSFVIFMIIVLVMNLGPLRPIKSSDQDNRVVGECGGYEIRYEELRYITLLHKATLDKSFGEYEKLDETSRKAYDAELEKKVMEDMVNNYVILSLCDKYGIDTSSVSLDKEVQAQVEAFVNNDLGGSKDKYVEFLADNDLTDAFLRLMYKVNILEGKLLDHFVEAGIDIEFGAENNGEFVKYVMNNDDWVRTIHVYYPKKSEYIDTSKSFDRAEAACERLNAESNDENRHSAMMSEIGKAPFVSGYSTTGNGIYFTYGQMGDAYETATFALELYGVSDVIEVDHGYYVIMRLPKIENDLKINADALLTQYQYAVLKKHENAQREELAFVGNEYFEGLALADIQ